MAAGRRDEEMRMLRFERRAERRAERELPVSKYPEKLR